MSRTDAAAGNPWGLTSAGIASSIGQPAQRAYLNDMIPSQQRATVLSFHSLLGSAGGVVTQPALGRAADVGGYGLSLLWGGVISALALPFLALSRAQHDPADTAVAPGEIAAEPRGDATGDDGR